MPIEKIQFETTTPVPIYHVANEIAKYASGKYPHLKFNGMLGESGDARDEKTIRKTLIVSNGPMTDDSGKTIYTVFSKEIEDTSFEVAVELKDLNLQKAIYEILKNDIKSVSVPSQN